MHHELLLKLRLLREKRLIQQLMVLMERQLLLVVVVMVVVRGQVERLVLQVVRLVMVMMMGRMLNVSWERR